MRRALKVLAAFAVALLAAVGAAVLLLPDRFVVNAPVRHLILGQGREAPPEAVVGERLLSPAGARLTRFATGVENARFLRFTDAGDLLVSQPRENGQITLLRGDRDGDGRSDGREVVISGLNRPHGMDVRDGWLYVAETDAVGRVRFDHASGKAAGAFERVVTGLPGGGNHWTRTIRFGPDGLLYVSIGSSCNACVEGDPRRAAIVRYRPDGSGEEVFATGLRNAVGFDWRPADGHIYATDNGRDLLGDDVPPCELNRVVKGGFYGWPYANGDRVPDPDFGKGQEARIAASIPPVHGFRAHNAPLGIAFLQSDRAPAAYRGAAIVALHGSWNRTRKDGYEVVSLHWGADGRIEERDFLTGFLGPDEEAIGRPVDVAEGPDGAVYVSDDYAGTVYRVEWAGGAAPPDSASARARGEVLWARHACAPCHDAAQAPPGMVVRPLLALSARYSTESLAGYLRAPNPPMPAYPLAADEREDLAAYLLARHP